MGIYLSQGVYRHIIGFGNASKAVYQIEAFWRTLRSPLNRHFMQYNTEK